MSHPAGTRAWEMFRFERRRRRTRLAVGFGLMAGAAMMFHWLGVSGAVSPAVELGRWVAWAVAAAGGAGVAICLGARRWRDVGRWRRGAIGEELTAAHLAGLPHRRWAVWHDLRVPGSRANIDHLVVGRTGVWVVDTKTTRGRVRAGWRSVRVGDRRLETASTRWEAEMVADRLTDSVGERLRRPVPVRPIVALHGGGLSRRGGLRRRGGRAGGIRVVRAEELVPFVRRGRRRLTRSEVRLVRDAVVRVFPVEGGS